MGDGSPKELSFRKHSLKCYRQGPLTRNPFLNFMRDFRKNVPCRTVIDAAKEGGKAWWKLSEDERLQYRLRAHKARRAAKKKPQKKRPKVPKITPKRAKGRC